MKATAPQAESATKASLANLALEVLAKAVAPAKSAIKASTPHAKSATKLTKLIPATLSLEVVAKAATPAELSTTAAASPTVTKVAAPQTEDAKDTTPATSPTEPSLATPAAGSVQGGQSSNAVPSPVRTKAPKSTNTKSKFEKVAKTTLITLKMANVGLEIANDVASNM